MLDLSPYRCGKQGWRDEWVMVTVRCMTDDAMNYGPCENCGRPCAEHSANDVVDCIAAWRYRHDRTDPLYEKLHLSLRGAQDYDAALALYWWIHNVSEDALGESWPWGWEQSVRDLVDSQRKRHDGEKYPDEKDCGVARSLRRAAGGWWWADADKDPVFVAEVR
jgi:hypothetical protein